MGKANVLIATAFTVIMGVSVCHAGETGAYPNGKFEGGSLAQNTLLPGVTADEFATIRAHCRQKWADNYEMRDFCQQSQMEALQKLKARGPIEQSEP